MRRVLLTLIASSVVLAVAGCTANAAATPQLQKYRPGSGGTITLPTSPGEHYAFDDITMCLEGEGIVTITDVEPIEPSGGFKVDMFSVQPAQAGEVSAYVSDYSVPLTAVGYPSTGEMAVTTTCPPDGDPGTHLNFTRLGIEVSRGDEAEPGTTRGIRVTYDSSGEERAIEYPLAIGLCDGEPDEECDVDPIRMD